jgi:hypothetical protein
MSSRKYAAYAINSPHDVSALPHQFAHDIKWHVWMMGWNASKWAVSVRHAPVDGLRGPLFSTPGAFSVLLDLLSPSPAEGSTLSPISASCLPYLLNISCYVLSALSPEHQLDRV